MRDELFKDNYPYIPYDIVDYFIKVFPDNLPSKEVGVFELGRLIGQQDVIKQIKTVHKWSEESLEEED